MDENKTWRRGAALLLLLLLPTLLSLYAGYTLPRQLRHLERESQIQVKYHEILSGIYHLNNGAQEYILYGDPQALNNFRFHSAETLKKELELYNLVEQSQKQDVSELISLNKAYNSFVEREVAGGRWRDGGRDILLWQYRDFSRQLVYRADALAGAARHENKASFDRAFSLLDKEGLLILLLSAFFTGAALYGLVKLWPWLVRCACLGDLAADSTNAVLVVDRKERLLYLNRAAGDLFGLPHEAAGKNLGEILTLHPHLQNIAQPLHDALLQNKRISGHRFSYPREENRLFLAVDCIPVHLFGRPAGAALTARETTRARDGSVLLETVEKERKHLSIEIHDWIGRYMSSIIHSLDYILRTGGELAAEMRENLLGLRAQCQSAAVDMRSIMQDIHPYLIEKVGLIPALESYSGNFERLHNIKVYIFYSQRSLRLNREEEILVYRIIQEALSNVARHSEATEVDIHFSGTRDTLQIEIIDNGGERGTAPAPGKGLWGMKERAALMGGDLVYGFKEGGFCITLTLPRANGDPVPGSAASRAPAAEGGGADGQDWDHAD